MSEWFRNTLPQPIRFFISGGIGSYLFYLLNELILKAQKVHNENFDKDDVQLASLISIKTGSCPEDCKYCPQSAHYNVNLKKENLINISEVKKAARIAKNNGAHRFCMGAAWKKLRNGKDLDTVIEIIK